MHYLIAEISREDEIWDALVQAAQSISEAVARQLEVEIESARSNHILVAMVDEQPVGLLRFITWRLGEDEGRPEIIFNGKTLTEAKVISFGVLPDYRNQGIGRALQKKGDGAGTRKGLLPAQVTQPVPKSGQPSFENFIGKRHPAQPGRRLGVLHHRFVK
jgi:GNAT superfamily N-acetyltransferase